jgi:hypothetical protein
MSDKPSLLDRLLGASKKKVDENQGALEAQIKAKLKGIVYDEELVTELTPLFMRLNGVEGFNQVFELLETKEKQIEAISGGDWFKQESDSSHKQEKEEEGSNLVDEILKKQYPEK